MFHFFCIPLSGGGNSWNENICPEENFQEVGMGKIFFKRLGWGKHISRGWDGENIFQEVGMGKIFYKKKIL